MPSPSKLQKSAAKRLLIIEDERPLSHALELKFSHEGYETHTCTDGVVALEEAKKGGYDVILLDLIMPKMDGFTLLQELNKAGIRTPVLVLSNLGQDEDRAKAKKLGAVEYYVKANTPITDIVNHVKSLT